MANLLPTDFATAALYSTYYQALADSYTAAKSSMTATETAESLAMMALVPRSQTTKIFTKVRGNWNDATSWYPAVIPVATDKVLIGEGCTCTYNLSAPTTKIARVRVDGTFKGDPTMSIALCVENFVVMPTGAFREGTRAARLSSSYTHQWIVDTSGGAIDVSYDTYFQSRGFFSMGVVDLWGAIKTGYLECAAYNSPSSPAAGATALTLASTPVGWAVGDEIVIGATRLTGRDWNGFAGVWLPSECEKRTLTSVAGAVLGWAGGLTYSHVGPQGSVSRTDLKAYVINLTRNIVFMDNSADTQHAITGITKANPGVVTYTGADTWANGDRIKIKGVVGMTQVNGQEFVVANLNAGANTFELQNTNTTSYTTYSSGGTVQTVVPINQRGHTMQMHQYNGWSARGVQWKDLGRTAKAGGKNGTILMSNAGALANASLPLSGSKYWNGSAISFGPAFVLIMNFVASGAGSFTVTGTDEADAAQTETVSYSSGSSGWITTTKYFRSVSDIKFTTAFASTLPVISVNARVRAIQESAGATKVLNIDSGTSVFTNVKNTVNPKGRYMFHWHRMGIAGSILTNPPVLDGCSFSHSPSWAVAQHQTHGHIKNCVGYDFTGAALVTEDGNETGIWADSCFMEVVGVGDDIHKDSVDLVARDPARSGAAYWFVSRPVHVSGLVAIGCDCGIVYNTRLGDTVGDTAANSILKDQLDQPYALRGAASSEVAHAPISRFDDYQAIACTRGFIVIKNNPNQRHDLRTPLRRPKIWSTSTAMDITYTSHYSMIDLDFVRGNISGAISASPTQGLIMSPVSDMSIINPVVDGFTDGINIAHAYFDVPPVFEFDPLNGRQVVNATYRACTNDLINYVAGQDLILTTAQLGTTLSLSGVSYSTGTGLITGTKTDELGSIPFPYGEDTLPLNRVTALNSLGYWVNTDSKKYVLWPEFYSSRLTGEMKCHILPVEVTDLIPGAYTNNGTMDLTNTTSPTFADFSVSVTRNTNLIVDIVGRASGNTVRFGAFQRGMKTYITDNGDGNITLMPLADENYSESVYVWVFDKHGNQTRATMTINVEKYAISLGRRDLIAA